MTGLVPTEATKTICSEPARQALVNLETYEGIHVAVSGHAVTPESKAPRMEMHLLPANGVRDVQRNLVRAINTKRFATILEASAVSPPTQARLRSCADITAAPWSRVIPDSPSTRMDDDEFVIAARHRLGLHVHPVGAQCHHENTGTRSSTPQDAPATETNRVCGAQLDSEGIHANLCETGPTRYRPHTAVTSSIQIVAKEARTEVATEEIIPHLHQTKIQDEWVFTAALPQQTQLDPQYETREARMDLQLWNPHWPMEMLVDVTVRNPLAARYVAQASIRSNHANDEAKKDKMRRYGPASRVKCAAIEIYGRMHDDFKDVLHNLDSAASLLSALPRRPSFERWAHRIQTALSRAVVRNIITAHGGKKRLSPCGNDTPSLPNAPCPPCHPMVAHATPPEQVNQAAVAQVASDNSGLPGTPGPDPWFPGVLQAVIAPAGVPTFAIFSPPPSPTSVPSLPPPVVSSP